MKEAVVMTVEDEVPPHHPFSRRRVGDLASARRETRQGQRRRVKSEEAYEDGTAIESIRCQVAMQKAGEWLVKASIAVGRNLGAGNERHRDEGSA